MAVIEYLSSTKEFEYYPTRIIVDILTEDKELYNSVKDVLIEPDNLFTTHDITVRECQLVRTTFEDWISEDTNGNRALIHMLNWCYDHVKWPAVVNALKTRSKTL